MNRLYDLVHTVITRNKCTILKANSKNTTKNELVGITIFFINMLTTKIISLAVFIVIFGLSNKC